jgi:hypothetical protein
MEGYIQVLMVNWLSESIKSFLYSRKRRDIFRWILEWRCSGSGSFEAERSKLRAVWEE